LKALRIQLIRVPRKYPWQTRLTRREADTADAIGESSVSNTLMKSGAKAYRINPLFQVVQNISSKMTGTTMEQWGITGHLSGQV
jgi:hypothetical protein